MNITIITHSYPPEIRSSSHLMFEMARWLRSRGNNVYVVTSYPKYHMKDASRVGNFGEYVDEDGIKVLRVKTLPIHDSNFILRGIAQLTMPYLFLRKIKKYILSDIDTVVIYSPPITLAQVGASLKRWHKKTFILNVQDLFPQNAIDLGILKNRMLIKLFESIEKKVYSSADRILVHSDGNREFLICNKNVDAQKVGIMHNWVDVAAFDKIRRAGKFRDAYGLKNKFVVLFAGVLGPSQGLDFIVDLAWNVRSHEDIVFLFVGDGIEKNRIAEVVKNRKISNIIFKPFVSKEEYPELVKDVDVGLVCLSNMNKTPVVPSKLLGYMAGGVPVLTILHKESDGHVIVKDSGCGRSIVYGEIEKATEALLDFYRQKQNLHGVGSNGRKYINDHMSIDKVLSTFEQELTSIC